jgi:hypothetical protein
MFDCKIAQIKRLAEREKPDNQEPIDLARAGHEQAWRHGSANYAVAVDPRQGAQAECQRAFPPFSHRKARL